MAISRSDYSPEGWGRVLQDRWDRLQQLVDSGRLDSHPLAGSWNDHSKLLRDARRAKDGGNVGEDTDDPPSNATTHGVTGGAREGARISEDAAQRLREWGISKRRVREIMTPSSVSAAARAGAAALIPGYRRLP